MNYRSLFLGFFVCVSITAQSAHALGGSITWECLANGQFKFTLTLYRDCAASNFSFNQNIQTNFGQNILCSKVSTSYLNRDCNAPTCANVGGTYLGAVQKQVYESQPVTLPNTIPASGLSFYWTQCCRPNYTNLASTSSSQDISLLAMMFPINSAPSNPCHNNSPEFLENPNFTICSNTPQSFTATAFDRDADSLYYEWNSVLTNSPWFQGFATYAVGYTPTQPFGTANTANLDSLTGRIDMDVNSIGLYGINVLVSEYRCGQLISRTAHESPIFVKPCSTPAGLCGGLANNAPNIQISYPPNADTLSAVLDSSGLVRYYEMTVAPNTPIEFTLQALDSDLKPNCAAQNIQFFAQSPFLANAPSYDSICDIGGNCATISSNNTNGSFFSSLSNSVTFNWTPTCNPGGNVPQWCTNSNEEFEFYFSFEDDACDFPKSVDILVRILVDNTANKPITTVSNNLICPNDSTQISAPLGYASYLWSTGDTSASIFVPPGTYWLEVNNSDGCLAVDTTVVNPIEPFSTQPEFCMVTYDYFSARNVLYWETPTKKNIVRYKIYRSDSGTDSLIGIKGVNGNSMFVDSSSQANKEYLYYLGIEDSCGLEYKYEAGAHRNIIINGTSINNGLRLSWLNYLNKPALQFYIYRGTSITGPMQLIDSVAGNFPIYMDSPLPAVGFLRYQVAAVLPDSCNISLGNASNLAYSNFFTYSQFGFNESAIESFNIYPNPSSAIFHVEFSDQAKYEVINSLGQVVFSDSVLPKELDLSNHTKGIYWLKVIADDGSFFVEPLMKL